MRPAGVLFDLDNSLIDRDGAFERWVETLGLTPGEVAWLRHIDDSGRAPRAQVCARLSARRPDLGSPHALWERMRAGIAAAVLPRPGVVDAVRRIARVARVGVVTNGGGDNQREKLRRSGLDELMGEVIISGEVGVAKPDPAIFAIALDGLGTVADETLFVGDSIINDIGGATNAGLTTCWLAGGRDPEHVAATFIVDVLEELPEALSIP